MGNVSNSEANEISKTQLILSILTEQGPKTEYDLYKQLPKLSHGTIHFCLNKLSQSGFIAYTQNKSKKKQTKKIYHLTFMGTVTAIASYLYWQTMELSDNQIEEHWKHFEEEEQAEVMDFLCKQGKLLKYALFEESKWLTERYPGVASVFTIIAHTICQHPPQPYRNLIRFAMVSGSRKKYLAFTDEKASEEKMPSLEELNKELQYAFRREFTRLFFESIVFMKHNDKATANPRLQLLAEEELEEKRHEASGVELAIRLFSGEDKTKVT